MGSALSFVVVGVTGKYCAGKNTMANILKVAGFEEIDVDRIGHHVLHDLRFEVVERFGPMVVNEDGAINRPVLGDIVFRDSKKLETLERILHPEMVKRIKLQLEHRKKPVVINAALLFRMGLYSLCDLVLCVKAPIILQIIRGMKRDRLSMPQIINRIAAQRKNCPKSIGFEVDIYYVWNFGSINSLQKKVLKAIEKVS